VTIAARCAAVLLAVVACRAKSPPEQGASVVSPDATSDAAPPDAASPDAGVDASVDAGAVAREAFPNARIRLKLHFHAPALPERTIEQTIWLSGTRFHVRDDAGRDLHEILGDVTYPRGLGLPATTMEEIMDRKDAARREPKGATDVFGDLASDAGWIAPAGGTPWAKSAGELAPIARQVLSGDRTPELTRAVEVTRLGRTATQYDDVIEVQEHGRALRTEVVRVMAPPYLLLDDRRDAETASYYYVREVLALDEGVVTDADVTPPSPGPSP
jgi:hypothetical protein